MSLIWPDQNETAFFKTNLGHPFRVEVNRKGALRNIERGEWRGDKLSFYSAMEEGKEATIVRIADTTGKDDALMKNRPPKVNIQEALAYTAPGIVAYQSALKEGEYMDIPDFDH